MSKRAEEAFTKEDVLKVSKQESLAFRRTLKIKMTMRYQYTPNKDMRNLNSILKSKDITLPTKICIVKAMVFPVVLYTCESWTIKKAERWRIDALELWCWRRLSRVPWSARRSSQSILKEINPLGNQNIHWQEKCWSFNTLATWCKELTHWKRPWCWESLKAGGQGDGRGEIVGWHHRLNEHEFEQALGVGDWQGSLECCSPWHHKSRVWLDDWTGLKFSICYRSWVLYFS